MMCQDRDESKEPCGWYQEGGFCKRADRFRCEEYIKVNEPVISYSGMRNYCDCPFKYYLSNVRGLQAIKPPIRVLAGKIMSECLDAIHSTSPKTTWENIIISYYDEYRDPEADPDKVISTELCKIDGFLRAYSEMPVAEDKGRTQAEFQWVKDGYPRVHGYMDMVRQDEAGGYAYEFKYSGNDNWLKFVVAGQLGTYFLGTDLQRIILRILKVPTIRPKNKEKQSEYIERVYDEVASSPKEYVRDFNYWRSEFDLEQIANQYKMIARDISTKLETGEWWRTENQDAHWRCEYLPICDSGVISEQLFKKRDK